MKRTARIAGAMAVLVAAGVLTRATVFFDPAAYWDEALRKLVEASGDGRAPPQLPDPLARFHAGAPPCALAVRREHVPPEEITAAVDALAAAGLLEVFPNATSLLWSWGDEDESARHGPVTDEQVLSPLRLNAGRWDRALITLNAGKLAAASRARADEARRDGMKRALDERQALTAPQAQALRTAFEAHPLALSFPGMMWVMPEAKRWRWRAPRATTRASSPSPARAAVGVPPVRRAARWTPAPTSRPRCPASPTASGR